jgi:hypothetical protein
MNTLKICTFSIVLVAFMFFLVGCSKDSNSTTIISPDDVTTSNADWMVVVGNWIDPSQKSSQSIVVVPTNLVDFLNYSLVFKIDGVELPLAHDNQIPVWSGTADLEPGQTYTFHVVITNNLTGGIQDLTTSAEMVYPVEASFPDPYHLNTNTLLTWSVAHDSQYQQVYVTSTSAANQVDEYEKRVSSSARSYTIPANCVTDYGSGSDISLEVNEFNYSHVGRLALFTASSSFANYPVAKNQTYDKSQMINQMVRRLKHFLNN